MCPAHEEDNVSVKSETKKKSPLRKMSIRKIIGKSSSSKESPAKEKVPLLRVEDLKQVPQSLLNELNALRIRCDYFENGCQAVLHIAELPEHLKKCEHTSAKPLTVFKLPKMADNQDNGANDDSRPVKQEFQLVNEEQEKPVIQPEDDGQTIEPKPATTTVPEAEVNERAESEVNKSRKDSCVSEDREEVGSDDFVVVDKDVSESRLSNGTESTGDNRSDKVANETDDKAAEKKKKKKKKKKNGGKKEDETLSTTSQNEEPVSIKEEERKAISESVPNATVISNLADAELNKMLGEFQNRIADLEAEKQLDEKKFENLKSVNMQLIAQIKQLQTESTSQQDSKPQQEQLKSLEQQLQTLRIQNEEQVRRIESLTAITGQYNKLLISMRNQEIKAKDRFVRTISQFTQAVQSLRATSA